MSAPSDSVSDRADRALVTAHAWELGADSAAPQPGDRQQVTPEVDAIVETIGRLVHEVIGEDYDLDLDITGDSSFSEDIELESIEFVALGERLQLTYGERIDLVGWFGELDLDEIIDLTVGELASFIAACLAGDRGDDGGRGGEAGA